MTPIDETSYRLEIYTIADRKEAWIVHPIEVNSTRDNSKLIPGQPARRRVSDQVSRSQLQWIHHTRTRRLSISASMIFDKLPSNWVNWRLQGPCQSPYIYKSRFTGNAKAGYSPEAFYELCAIHIDPHRQRRLKSRSRSTRLDGVIYITDAVRNSSSSYAMILRLPIWLPVSLVFRRAKFKIVDQQSQIVWQLRKGYIIIPPPNVLKWLAGTIRYYYCQLSPFAPDWTTESNHCEEREPSAPTLFYFVKQENESWSPTSEYGCAPYNGIWRGFLWLQWWCLFVIGILSIHGATGWTFWALLEDQRIQHVLKVWRFNWCVVSPCGNGHYLLVRQSQLGEARWLIGCQTVPIGRDKYVIHLMSLFVHMVAAAVDTRWAGDW